MVQVVGVLLLFRWWGVVFDVVGVGGGGGMRTGGMPRRVGVYIRIIVPVCFHSFCF